MGLETRENLDFDDIVVQSDHIQYWQRRFKDRSQLVSSQIVDTILYNYYDASDKNEWFTFEQDNKEVKYPILTKQEWIGHSIDASNLFGSVDDDWSVEYDRQFIWDTCMQQASLTLDQDITSEIIQVRDYVWNSPYHKFKDIHVEEDGFSIDLGLTDYYTYISKSHRMVEEMYDQCRRFSVSSNTSPDDASEMIVGRLPFRDEFASTFSDIYRGNNYQIVSFLITTVIERDGEKYIIAMERDNTNVDYPNTIGVAPSGVISPLFNARKEADGEYLILRKFGEEVLRINTINSDCNPTSKDWISNIDEIKSIQTEIQEDGGELCITGFGFNALSAAPQVYGVLNISSEDISDELFDLIENREKSDEGQLRVQNLSSAVEDSMENPKWAPGAAVCLQQAYEFLNN